jgi:hypothetical protein
LIWAFFPCPANLPAIHLADAARSVLAKQPREAFVAKAASGSKRIRQMIFPMIRGLFAEGCCDRHLRHHGRPAAADQAAVGKNDRSALPRRFQRRIHACATGADHQNVGCDMVRFVRSVPGSTQTHNRLHHRVNILRSIRAARRGR